MTDVIVRGDRRPAGVEMAGFRAADLPEVLALLGRCSSSALYHRFHGFTNGASWAVGLVTQAGVRTLCAWAGGSCVAVAALGGPPHSPPELGVLVEDAWQRRGVGSALVGRLVSSARAEGLPSVRADILAEDSFALAVLRRYGSLDVRLERGVFSVEVELAADGAAAGGGP